LSKTGVIDTFVLGFRNLYDHVEFKYVSSSFNLGGYFEVGPFPNLNTPNGFETAVIRYPVTNGTSDDTTKTGSVAYQSVDGNLGFDIGWNVIDNYGFGGWSTGPQGNIRINVDYYDTGANIAIMTVILGPEGPVEE